jgi:hypothetical protein
MRQPKMINRLLELPKALAFKPIPSAYSDNEKNGSLPSR